VANPFHPEPAGSTRYRPVSRDKPLADHDVPIPGSDERNRPADDSARSDRKLSPPPLAAVLDMIDHGIVLARSDSRLCYSNTAARRLLAADAEGVLAREIRVISRVACGQGVRAPAEADVASRAGQFRLRATLLPQHLSDLESATVLITIERARATLPSREFVMRRFAMTAREADVALLLARGIRNAAIASELNISTHTARHHTESVLAKLNLHSRAEVARALVAGSAGGDTGGR
jgi:DNA-binding CsgD family transcriptional regulator